MRANSASSLLEIFSQLAEEKIFKPGQLLASKDFLPSQVYLIWKEPQVTLSDTRVLYL